MNSRKILLLVATCLISLSLILASCSKTVTTEQKRADVVIYLKAFNSIENDFETIGSTVVFPSKWTGTLDRIAWNAAVTKFLTAIDGAISRLAELKPSSLESSTLTHLQQAKLVYQSYRTVVKALQDVVAVGNEADIYRKYDDLDNPAASARLLTRATEQLMLQYNISDSEVIYLGR